MKILVAGGFGFVGGRVAQALRRSGSDVVLGSSKERMAPSWFSDAEVRKIDWSCRFSLQNACADVDVVLNVAGTNASDSAADPVHALQVNGVQSAALIEAAIKTGVSRYVYFSTAHVYGSPLVGRINEKSSLSNLHPYATSHQAGENVLLYALSSKKISGTVLRLSNGFGAPMSPEVNCWVLLVNDLCRQAVRDRRLVLQSQGDQMRDFVPLSAVCDEVMNLLNLPNESIPNILNIGCGRSHSVFAMAELIQKRCAMIFGYAPSIQVGQRKEDSGSLCYESLYSGTLKLADSDILSEIDNLLMYCDGIYSNS